MKLAAFYAIVGLVYLVVSLVNLHTAERLFPFVALVLLIASMYAEYLRITGDD